MKNNIFKIRIDGDDIFYFNYYSKWYAQFFDLNITNSIISKRNFQNWVSHQFFTLHLIKKFLA